MESLGMTSFDILFFVIVGLSLLFGLVRGFTAAVLSFLAWIAATLATLYALPLLRPEAQKLIEPESLADIIIVIVVGFGCLFLFKLLANKIGDAVKSGVLGPLDRVLGALFGLLRGVLVITLLFMLAIWVIPRKSLPGWILEAKTRPIVEYGATIIASVTPSVLIEKLGDLDFNLDTGGISMDGLDRNAIDTVKDHLPFRSEASRTETADGSGKGYQANKGYQDRDREDLDRLIDQTK